MLATRFDNVFVVPVASRATRSHSRSRNCIVDDLEFSEMGRSPRQSLMWVFLALTCFWAVVAGVIVVAL